MNEQAVQGIAHADAPRLGVVHDSAALAEVAVLVEVGVDDAGSRLDDRHPGVVAHEVNELAASAGDAEVHISHGIQQFSRGLVGGGQQGHGVGVYVMALQHVVDETYGRAVGGVGIASALEDAGIAALEAEREDVEGDVGTGFVDHADDAEGHADAMQL